MYALALARTAPDLFLLSALVNPSSSRLVRVHGTTSCPKLVYIPTRSLRSRETLLEGLQRPVYLDDARRPAKGKSTERLGEGEYERKRDGEREIEKEKRGEGRGEKT